MNIALRHSCPEKKKKKIEDWEKRGIKSMLIKIGNGLC